MILFEGGNEWFCVRSALKGHIEDALTTSSTSSIAPYYFLNNLNCILPLLLIADTYSLSILLWLHSLDSLFLFYP